MDNGAVGKMYTRPIDNILHYIQDNGEIIKLFCDQSIG